MNGIFIKDEDCIAEIVANEFYGADFKASIFDQDNNDYLVENLSMVELSEPLDVNVSTNNTSNQVAGDTTIELDSIDNLSVSDRVKIGNYIYKIIQILNNNITIGKGLYENVSSGTAVTNVGNLGIYKLDLNISTLGNFTLIGKDTTFGLKVTKMIKVLPKSLETMYKDIKNLEYAILGA